MPEPRPLRIGFLVFEGMTQLDATGPFEVLGNLPGTEVLLVAKTVRPITASHGFRLIPHTDLRRCPKLDVLCIPGGTGINRLLVDWQVIAFVRRQARTARYVTSVCTGSLLLGAAGLLDGRHAACHWMSLELLRAFGAIPSKKRLVRDGRFITAGGVTSGIDFALVLAAKLAGPRVAKAIQLALQYDPHPPFQSGTPAKAGRTLTIQVIGRSRAAQLARAALCGKIGATRPPASGRSRKAHPVQLNPPRARLGRGGRSPDSG